ncbi:hypothetical protein LZ30DRAFT_367284 [Colletotrichum cereale]|nr:hypothetical protein LZ30DRAFT_367284 [Colletotrichum cereale]
MAISGQLPANHQVQGGKPLDEVPRLRFDDFSYESQISGPQIPSRPLPPRQRASWAFPLRRGPGFQLDLSASTSSDTTSRSTISTSEGTSEPPPSGIMKTMEFQLSYEARTWTRQGRMGQQAERRTLRPSTIADIRSITSGDVPPFPEGISSISPRGKVQKGGDERACYRHSSPPVSCWEWLADGQMRPISMKGVVQPHTDQLHR